MIAVLIRRGLSAIASLWVLALLIGCASAPQPQRTPSDQRVANIRSLIEKGKDLNQPDQFGNFPLQYAVGDLGDVELARALLDKGASPNCRNQSGQFPLMQAVLRGDDELVTLLLSRGADVTLTSAKGWTALHFAADQGRTANAKQLLDAGANVNATTINGESPLTLAIFQEQETTAQLLLDRRANLNQQTQGLDTPLIAAAGASRLKMVNFLIGKGADIERKGLGGRTALIVASVIGNTQVCHALISAGAHLDATDNNGIDALTAAIHTHQLDTAKVLITAGAVYPPGTNTLAEAYHYAIYQKLLADEQTARGDIAESTRNYSSAQSTLSRARKEFLDTAVALDKSAATKEFWHTMLVITVQALGAGIQDFAAQQAQYSSSHTFAQIAALRTASNPQQYSANYNYLMSHYNPTPVYSASTAANCGGAPQTWTGAAGLRMKAFVLRERVEVCDLLLADIQKSVPLPK